MSGGKETNGASAIVLVVEGDDAARAVLRDLLKKNGYEAAEARHGAEALGLLAGGLGPAVILLDVALFRRLELARRAFADVPVIVMNAGDEQVGDGARFRAQGFVEKPVEERALLREIANVIRARE